MHLFDTIKEKCVSFGKKFVAFWVKFGLFFYHFPGNFVKFWRAFGLGIYNFFRDLPPIHKSKD